MKHNHFSKLQKNDRKIGLILLILGGSLLLISLIINLVFINGTNFKKEYRNRQHQACLEKNNSLTTCDNDYPI